MVSRTNSVSSSTHGKVDVIIVGAGPYGLSIASHLKARAVSFRIFGKPMGFWRHNMPQGMKLKSEGFASSLYDPDSELPLSTYCEKKGLPYADMDLPVPIATFVEYGMAFQEQFVPEVEDKTVTSIRRAADGFETQLADGEVARSARVVVAVGLTYFAQLPPVLADLPGDLVSHSSRHSALDDFHGRDVTVIGAGASAMDLAALLKQVGARVQVVVRGPAVEFHGKRKRTPTTWDQIRNPMTGIGPGWKLLCCVQMPLVFRHLPQDFRFGVAARVLGPAPGWFIKDEVVGKIPILVGRTITSASAVDGRVCLQLVDATGARESLVTEHVIAATGYKVDIGRITILDDDVRSAVTTRLGTPVLSSNFESSVPGLYFVGVSSNHTFGPLVRFAYGAKFTARRLSSHLARSRTVRQ